MLYKIFRAGDSAGAAEKGEGQIHASVRNSDGLKRLIVQPRACLIQVNIGDGSLDYRRSRAFGFPVMRVF